jgi:hypothetical protein
MIPDSRISRIRFEAMAYTMHLPTAGGPLKSLVDIHWFHLKFMHSLASRLDYRSWPTQRPAPVHKTRTTCPEVLCSRSVTFLHCYYNLMCQSRSLSPTSLIKLAGQSLQLGPSAAGLQDLPDVRLANPSPDAWTFTPAASGVPLPVSSSRASAFPKTVAGRRLAESAQRLSCGTVFRSCSHSLMFRPPGLLAIQVVPTDAAFARGGHDFYFRAPYELLPLHTSDMLAVRFRAIDGRGLAPHKIRGVVGRIHR